MRRLAGLLFIIMLCFPTLVFAGDGEQNNRALLIGIDTFVTEADTTPSAANNVQVMKEALTGSAEPFGSIVVPDQAVTTVEELSAWIAQAFENADDDDVSYLYISTHGVYTDDGEAALLLSDGECENCLTAVQLENLLENIPGEKVVLLDACYSGAFIGKGTPEQQDEICFQSSDYKVLTSSGALEESWYWSGQNDETQGSYYFTKILAQGLSRQWDYPADQNRDGEITLLELYQYLLENHGASTPQVYPQEDETVIFVYDTQAASSVEQSAVLDVVFSDDVISADETLTLSYTVTRPVRVAYQIVYQKDGHWQFEEAELIYDDAERFTAFGDLAGAVTAGRKVRDISLTQDEDDLYGYVLVQVLSLEDDELTVQTGHVITVTPLAGEVTLQVDVPSVFAAEDGAELLIFVGYSLPCALSVTIVDEEDQTIKRLAYRSSVRPLGITPEGSCFYWNGLNRNGDPAPEGKYRVVVEGWIGDTMVSVMSDYFEIIR